MFLTVTPNAAIDKTAVVQGFAVNHRHVVKHIHAQPGGKGINVARVLKAFGTPVFASGFVGGETGKLIKMGLEREGIRGDFGIVMGESRTCLAILDPQRGTVTEVDEAGPEVTAQEVTKLTAIIQRYATRSTPTVFAGSLPPGVAPDTYRKWIDIVQRTGGKAYLDAKGPALVHGLEASPYLVKPNQVEAEEVLGYHLDTETRISQAIEYFLRKAHIAVITLGERGAAIGCEGERWRVYAPPVKAVSTVGSGDAFMAGFIVGLNRGLPLKECARLAAATGAANTQSVSPGTIRLEQVDRLQSQIRVDALRG